jgi:sentrin-specific protease 7
MWDSALCCHSCESYSHLFLMFRILVYPPPPSKGGIPINTEDYACLGEDQFLNDVIIDFYLK